MLVLFLFIIIFFTSEIEIEVKELSLKLNEISKKAFWRNLKYDIKIILRVLYIPINITSIIMKMIIKRKNMERKSKIISYIKSLKIRHSDTNLKMVFGIGDVFITSLLIPQITTIVLSFLGRFGKPQVTIFPSYSENFNLEFDLKTNLKCSLYKFLNIILKDRKNNKENI